MPSTAHSETRSVRPAIAPGQQSAAVHEGEALQSPGLERSPSASSSLSERIDLKAARIEAWYEMTGDRSSHLNISTTKLQVNALREFLDTLKEPYRQRCIDKIEEIATPTAETLERNGLQVRRLTQLENYPDIRSELRDLMRERYWLDRDGSPEFSKKWNLSTRELNKHPGLEEHFFANKEQAAERYDAALKFMCMTDPDVQTIIAKIPLPEETLERMQMRRLLTERSEFSFGDAQIVHSNKTGFTGEFVLTQRAWDTLGLGGALPDGGASRTPPTNMSAELLPWKTIDDLRAQHSAGDSRVDGIAQALDRAARTNGFHVVGDFYDPYGRDLLGLDDRIFWQIATPGREVSDYYGHHIIAVPLHSVPDAIVSLGDDVMINLQTRLEAVPQYANGLLSVKQYQELVLDHAVKSPTGEVAFSLPNVPFFLTNDHRYEVQTRGCLALR
jgi:hypothetical protein